MTEEHDIAARLEAIESQRGRSLNRVYWFAIFATLSFLGLTVALYTSRMALLESETALREAKEQSEIALEAQAHAEMERHLAQQAIFELELLVDELSAAQATVSQTASDGVAQFEQLTVYVGDSPPSDAIDIRLTCMDASSVEDAVERAIDEKALDGFELYSLTRIATLSGGMCGHSYFSALLVRSN